MGTSALKSSSITNRDATPRVLNNGRIQGAPVRRAYGSVTAVAADDTASRYRMCEVPSNAFVLGVYLSSVAQGGSASANVGVYRNTADGAAAVAATLFASAISVVSAVARTDVTNQSANYTAALREQPLWQAAGLASDPGGTLDIVVAPSAAFTNGGLVGLEVLYTQ